MNTTGPNHDGWTDCPSGEVAGMVRRLRGRRRMQAVRQITTGLALCAIVLAGGYSLQSLVLPSGSTHSGLTCSEVRQLGKEYAAGTLDAETAAHVEEHLAHCPECEEFFAKMENAKPNPNDAGAAQPAGAPKGHRVAALPPSRPVALASAR